MNRHCGVVLHGLGDVVNIDVVAENLLGVLVHHLDRRPGEPNEGRVRQALPHIVGKAITHFSRLGVDLSIESILAAVCLIHKHHHVPASGENLEIPIFGAKLLDCCKNNSARLAIEQLPQLCHLGDLLGVLAKQFSAAGKCPEKLVIQIVSIRQHDQCRVL